MFEKGRRTRLGALGVIISLLSILIVDSSVIFFCSVYLLTFKKDTYDGWKLVRSYIEAGIPMDNIMRLQLS